MRRAARMRAALDAAAIPTFSGPRAMAESADAIRFLRAPGWLPRGRRVYAIGDVHGCRDKLKALHALIAADLAARPTGSAVLVHLGDYIDQGPDSAGVVALLAAGPPVAGPGGGQPDGRPRAHAAGRAGRRPSGGDRLAVGWRARGAGKLGPADPDLPREDWEAALPRRPCGVAAQPGADPSRGRLPVRPRRHPPRRRPGGADAGRPGDDAPAVPVDRAGSRGCGRAWPLLGTRRCRSRRTGSGWIPAPGSAAS